MVLEFDMNEIKMVVAAATTTSMKHKPYTYNAILWYIRTTPHTQTHTLIHIYKRRLNTQA